MNVESPAGRPPVGLILICGVAGLLVFWLGMTLAEVVQFGVRISALALVIFFSLAVALRLRANARTRRFWRLAFAYSVAGCAVLLSEFVGDWAVGLSGDSAATLTGFTALKFGEDVAIVGTIIILALVTRDKLAELYLQRGNLRLGLTIGLLAFGSLTLLGSGLTQQQAIASERMIGVLPAFMLIALADGVMEELLFRGLFLKRLTAVMGFAWANGVTAAVFALAHVGVQFTTALPLFVIVVFFLGLLWGWLIRYTGSVLASVLVHAGADMLIIGDAMNAFSVGL